MSNAKKIEYGQVTVDRILDPLQGAKKQKAMLRQTVQHIYPAASNGNDANYGGEGLYDSKAFGDGQKYAEKRVVLVDVPLGTKKADVEKMLAANPDATLFKVLSVEPVLTDNQLVSMDNGINPLTIDDYAERQMVINPETEEMVPYRGNPQYRVIFFSKKRVADKDYRSQATALAEAALQPSKEEAELDKASVEA